MDDRHEMTQRIGRAFEAAAERLAARGCSEAEIGKAMVATGLSIWSRAVGLEHVTSQLATMTLGLAEATGQDLEQPEPDMSKSH